TKLYLDKRDDKTYVMLNLCCKRNVKLNLDVI
ncbi:integrase, partial [Salmonella enterica subsp. diarizonae]|nr:integrase [Salmonella enterica subsp. diarizonae]